MDSRVRFGILGTGRMAHSFATSLQGDSLAIVNAVASRSQSTAQSFASQFNIQHAHESYADLIANPDVDVVYVATPHSLHCQNSLDCIDAGKAVLCEKPFTLNSAEASQVISRARGAKCFVMEAMWTRFLPAIVELRRLLDSGVVGDIQTVIAGGAFMPPFDAQAYLFNRSLGGGALLDAGVYLVSMASMILGDPNAVHAVGRLGETGVDENNAIVLGHNSGAGGLLHVSLRAQSPPDLQILGSLGSIHVHAPIFAPAQLTLNLHDSGTQELELPFERNGYQYQVAHVAECLRAGRLESPTMPLDESLAIMETMDAIRRQTGVVYPQES